MVAECKLNCNRESSTRLVMKREMKTLITTSSPDSKYHALMKRKRKHHDEQEANITAINKTIDSPSASPQPAKSLIHHLHRRFLIKILEYGFYKNKSGIDSRAEYIPQTSFRILNKFQDIAFKTCAGKVPKWFLEFSYVMFKIAYENRGTNIKEIIKENEEADIIQFLTECYESVKPMKFNKGDTFCPDEVLFKC